MNPKLSPLAERLREAQATGTPCAPLTGSNDDLSVEDAYEIQAMNLAARQEKGLHGRPARLVGHKIGITSQAVMDWLKVDEPDFGGLLDDMAVDDGGLADSSLLLQPRVEGEVAFVLGKDLEGPGVTAAEVLRATDFLLPSIEIIDSRIAEWKIKYEDTIADNASSGLFVVGSVPVSPRGLDLELAGMALRKNGRVVSSGVGAACLNNPVNAVVWLANKLGELGAKLEAGHVILSGALGPVNPVEPGDDVTLDISGLGRCSVRFS
jgi:2-oxopent-4-enoate/cis-2-oxohex-4-enoate hydratase